MLSPGGARLATPKSRALTSESWTNSSKRSASKPDRVKHPATLPDRRASSAPATCAGKSRRHSARRRRGSARRFATDSPLERDGFELSVQGTASSGQVVRQPAEGRRRRCRLERSKRVKLVGTQADRRRGKILLEMRYRGGPGNWQHGGGTPQQPGERNLAGRGAMALGDPNEPRVWGSEPARGQRIPRDKGDTGISAHIDQPVGRSIAEIVAVLDRDDLADGACSGKLSL